MCYNCCFVFNWILNFIRKRGFLSARKQKTQTREHKYSERCFPAIYMIFKQNLLDAIMSNGWEY